MDLTPKDQDKAKDFKTVLKESLRTSTRTRINIPGFIKEFSEFSRIKIFAARKDITFKIVEKTF